MARSTSYARIASAREGTAKSIVADQVSHAVQSTTYLLHPIPQSYPFHVPPSLPSYMLIKILHAYCNIFFKSFFLHLLHSSSYPCTGVLEVTGFDFETGCVSE